MKKLFLLLLMVVATIGVAVAQNRTISGTVTYEGDGEPLAGVTIMPIGGGHGVATDIDGHFSLKVPATVKMIRVSYVGMHTQEVPIGQNMKIVMSNNDNKLDEVMVVAYGTAKKSAFTGSAAVVDAGKIENAMVTNAVNALKGNVPGVQITSSNGQPGSSPSIRIRGVGSINASADPLYVLDGMPFDGDIASINTMDVESMTVLKDAAAAALYGARGANGVIIITTKKGRTGSARVTIDARWGANSRQIGNYNVVNSPAQYHELAYQAVKTGFENQGALYGHNIANQWMLNPTVNGNAFGPGYRIYSVPEGQDLIGTNGKLNPNATLGWVNPNGYYLTPDNWADNTFIHGLRQEYNLTIQGGTDRLNYYVSGGYLGDEGTIIGSDYKRISTRTAIDYQAKSWLKIGTNMAYNHVSNGYPSDQTTTNSGSNAYLMANQMAPIYPMFIRDASGAIVMDQQTGHPVYDYGDATLNGFGTRKFYNKSNAVSDLIYSSNRYFMDIFQGKWYATVTPIEGLDITGNLGYFLDNSRNHELTSSRYGQMASYGGTAKQNQSRLSSVNFQLLGTYKFTLAEKHNFDLLAGYESYERHDESLEAYGQNLYNPWNWTVNNTLNGANRKGYGSAGAYSTRGILARVNYDFDGKYYVSGSYRRDASSRFHPDKRWGNFFSASVAWDLAKEGFLQNSTWVDLLKVKASFGQQGNDGIGNYYAYLDQYSLTGTEEWSDATLVYKGNPDLTWETSDTWNAGVDFGFKQGLISGTVEYFNRKVSDMLYNKPVAPSNGYTYIPMNVGAIRNQGVEFDLNIRPINTRDWTWDINLNATYVDSKVLSLAKDLYKDEFGCPALIGGTQVYVEGGPLYELYLPTYAGPLQEDEYANYVTKEGDPIYKAGSPSWWALVDKLDEQGNRIPEYEKGKPGDKMDSEGFKLDENGKRIQIGWEQEERITGNYNAANTNNRKRTGSLMPKVYGGFGTTLRFKGFEVSAQFSYQLGGKVYDSGYTSLMFNGGSSDLGRAWHADILNAWTPDNRNTNIPRLDYNAAYNVSGNYSTFGLISSDYLSLNNVTVAYTLPDNLVARIGLESVRIYAAGDNLCLWTRRKGLDPRNGLAGYLDSNLYYSAVRNISGGIRVTF